MRARSHALVVGGTGMLAGASMSLARACRCVSVIARNPSRLYDLQRRAASDHRIIHPIIVDYGKSALLSAALSAAVAKHGQFDLVMSWIHTSGSSAIDVIASHLRTSATPCDWIEVLGSSDVDPPETSPSSSVATTIRHYRVVLGFKIEDGQSRWLTDEEISEGCIEAMESRRTLTTIGTTRPWSARPPIVTQR